MPEQIDEPTHSELYRAITRLEKAIIGNGQPGIEQRLTKLETKFDGHTQQHSLGGFTRKQIVGYGTLGLTFAGFVAGLVAKVI